MATLDYQMGTPLGPDPRAVADLAAIDDFVRTVARTKTAEFPESLALVEEYERWRQGISWFDLNVMVNDTMRSAKAKRDGINRAQGAVLPPEWSVEPGAFQTPPEDPDKSGPSAGAAWLLLGIAAGAGIAVWLVTKFKVKT